jgi:hypothetical protein
MTIKVQPIIRIKRWTTSEVFTSNPRPALLNSVLGRATIRIFGEKM